jgi:hypothetical protein
MVCFRHFLVIAGVAAALAPGTRAQAQASPCPEPPEPSVERAEAPFVFVECRRCSSAQIRQEIDFVNHVREPDQAQVHVLVTDQPTGAGGRRFTIAFIGRGEFQGVDNTLTYVSPQSNSYAEEQDGLAAILRLGLVPYAARTALAAQLSVHFDGDAVAAVPAHDPWANWTFEVYGGGNANTETTQTAWNARYGFYANRVTEEWKIRVRPYFNHNVRSIRREGEDEIRTDQRRHGLETFIIRSVGPHLGIGFFADYATTTIDNIRHGVTITPAIEYSLFPYADATRRQITLTYRLGYEIADYFEETIFEKLDDRLLNQSLNAAVQFRQPWGAISSGLTGLRYFHDGDHHRLTADGNVSFRLGHGISLNVGGSYQRINDQLSLPRRDASLEDILLERTRLATAYRGSASVGLSYTFGSIFANVVNPRF